MKKNILVSPEVSNPAHGEGSCLLPVSPAGTTRTLRPCEESSTSSLTAAIMTAAMDSHTVAPGITLDL